MPGAVELNPNKVKPLTDIARKDENGSWRAGPDNKKGLEPGQFISADYAEKARSSRANANFVKSIMRNKDVPESEAREIGDDLRQRLEDADSETERRDIRRELLNY